MKITLVCTLLFAVFLRSSNQQCLTLNDFRIPSPNGREVLYHGQQGFSLDLLQAINQLNPDGNIFFSPYSTYHALLIAYFISGNQTEDLLKKSLRLDPTQDKTDVFNAYKFDKTITQVLASNSSYEFTSANRIYVEQKILFRKCITNIFNDEFRTANFQNNPEAARTGINQWIETQTHEMIKDLLPPGTIDSQTKLVLVSAAYFKGKWENKFDAEETKPEVFYISPSKQTIVMMMHIKTIFNHDVSETLMAHILELPYQGGDISMYILLPPFSKDGIEIVLKKLTLENFKSLVNGSLLPRQVQVSLPKFSLEHSIELVPILKHLGVGNLFRQDADSSKLTGARDSSVGEGIHKAKIEVNEEGRRAAAASDVYSRRKMQDENDRIVEFKCNRPFIFLLYNKNTHTILFAGVYRGPA